MKPGIHCHSFRTAILLVLLAFNAVVCAEPAVPDYQDLRASFVKPDHARWGEVPLWWWEGDRMTKERVTWQLETLAAKGVKAVCPIQRSPGRCDPPSFSDSWWEMFEYAYAECKRLGMTLWAYDQVGYGQYGWLEKAAAKAKDTRTRRIAFLTKDGNPVTGIRLELPAGEVIGARAYPVENGQADDLRNIDLVGAVRNRVLEWTPPNGNWRVAVSVAVPYQSFQLSDVAAETFLEMLYGQIERRLGKEAMGTHFGGVFQDEHPPTPRDIYTQQLAESFHRRFGYEIGRALPALHFDVGPRTPKYRSDFFDAYLALDEESYWKKIYDWTDSRGLLTSHDNWGRQNINRQSQGYIDYFRTQRWFSAPGFDDYGQAPLTQRNYYDTKIAASIARLYQRPRVWNEAFHSSGWGRTTDQTLTWLSADYAFGANLYDEHGLYYSTRASTWEHAAPDPHWRQPYWRYYQTLSDWVARMSYLMSQGNHVVDVAVHYPVVSLLAGEPLETQAPDYNLYMKLSRTLYDAALDNDIIDDDSILSGTVKDGQLIKAGNGYRALVFGPETTVRRSVLSRALELTETGGTVIFFGRLPSGSTEGGRADPEVTKLLERLLGSTASDGPQEKAITKTFPSGGFSAFVPHTASELPRLITQHIDRDFTPEGGKVFVHHRRIGGVHVTLVQNATDGPLNLRARCRIDAVPELWDPFTGTVGPVDRFERRDEATFIEQNLEGHTASLLVFRLGNERRGTGALSEIQRLPKQLAHDWIFSVIPTRDNRWGEFRWPPSEDVMGPEVRTLRYTEETAVSGIENGWHQPGFDDQHWATFVAGIGPHWLTLGPVPTDFDITAIVETPDQIQAGARSQLKNPQATWQTVDFSKTISLAKPAPWGGHSGYPDGAVDQNFIDLPEGRKLLFTRIHSSSERRLGLRVELRNSNARLWVNRVEQPFEDAIGNLPLRPGANSVLLDLPDGGRGMLFVQAEPPAVASMAEAALGIVTPDLKAASWIWGGNTTAGYVRKTFRLDHPPAEARIVITAYTGYRLFVNGVKIEEEIGPWARWKQPRTFNVAKHLGAGENVIAVWGQVHADLGVVEKRGLILTLKMRDGDGKETTLITDGSWKGSVSEHEGWNTINFEDSTWEPVIEFGRMGVAPWGLTPLENIASVTEPHRRLAIDLPSPYLECFNEVPDIVYDIKPREAKRIGWYRFQAPPGLHRLELGTHAKAQVWVDGIAARVHDGVADVTGPPRGISTVAIRLEMERGVYGGAAFPQPLGLELKGGLIQAGEWSNYALPTYSGIGVYRQDVRFTGEEAQRRTVLDLGQVLVAAELLVNGKPAGVRLARPFKFDLTDLIHEGNNAIEVRIANTIAPHYTVTTRSANLGPTASGLIGPVRLYQESPGKN